MYQYYGSFYMVERGQVIDNARGINDRTFALISAQYKFAFAPQQYLGSFCSVLISICSSVVGFAENKLVLSL